MTRQVVEMLPAARVPVAIGQPRVVVYMGGPRVQVALQGRRTPRAVTSPSRPPKHPSYELPAGGEGG